MIHCGISGSRMAICNLVSRNVFNTGGLKLIRLMLIDKPFSIIKLCKLYENNLINNFSSSFYVVVFFD